MRKYIFLILGISILGVLYFYTFHNKISVPVLQDHFDSLPNKGNPSIIHGTIGSSYIMYWKDNYVQIVTNEDFMKNIFIAEPTVKYFQSRYNDIFQVDKIKLDNDYNENIAYKLVFKDSYVVIHHYIYEGVDCDQYKKIDSHNIAYGIIRDKGIELKYNIHIGMNKEDILIEKFGFPHIQSIDTLSFGDEMGDIGQQFIFKGDTLEKVLISSNYDFVEFNFYDKWLKE